MVIMSAFSPLSAVHYGVPHGVGFHKGYITDLGPQSLYPRSPCACCHHEMFFQPQFVQDRPACWSPPVHNHLVYPQESIVQEKEKQTKTKIEYKKPKLSYVELIAEAILSSPEKHLVLGDIYEAIVEKYPYFETRGSGWRNSIRHNLSLSDCFIKGERSPNGKGHFWEVNHDFYNTGGRGKTKLQKKKLEKLAGRTKSKTDYIHYEVSNEKEISTENLKLLPDGVQKLSLLSQIRFDDEIREFEIARMKLTEVRRG